MGVWTPGPGPTEGNDTFVGDNTNEIASGLGGNDIMHGNGGNDELDGNDGDDQLFGGDGNDDLSGRNGNDIIFGGDGDDTCDGDAGDDTMTGGAGNDFYTVEQVGDIVIEEDGGGVDTVAAWMTYSLADVDFVENLILAWLEPGALSGIGNSLNNTITGNQFDNVLSGAAGDDTLDGDTGNDTLDGGDGNDTLNGGSGNDILRIRASQAAAGETLNGGTNTDTIEMYGSVDFTAHTVQAIEVITFLRDTGAETALQATFRGDQLDVLTTVVGSTAADTLVINASNGVSYSVESLTFTNWLANDIVYYIGAPAATFNDHFVGSNGVDIIISNGGGDFLDGRGGDDYIASAGGDSQSLIGGSGFNTLIVQRGIAVSGGALSGFYRSSFTASNLAGISAIDFGAPISIPNDIGVSKVIDLNGSQIDAGEVSTQLQVNGVADHSDVIEITLTFGSINLSQWSFTNWTSLNGAFDPGSEDAIFIFGADDGTGLVGTSQGDVISAAGGNDIVDAGDGSDQVNGGDGNDSIDGGSGADTLNAGDGDDILNGGLGIDALDGGNGADTFVYAIGDGNGSMNGGAGADVLNLTDGAAGNILNASYDGSALTALAGNSLTGIETINANMGGGVDWLIYSATAAVTVNLGLGTASGFTSVAGVERVIGGSGDDSLTGDGADNRLDGGLGADLLIGGAGVDTLIGGDGDDSFSGGLGNDSIQGGAGNDTINWTLGEGRDTIDGGADVDAFNPVGSASADLGVVTWNGSSLTALMDNGLANIENINLDLGLGVDWLIYNATAAVTVNLQLGAASGFVFISNIEKVIGGGGDDTLTGNGADNRLDGQGGADTLDGGGGSDAVLGGDGNDTIYASAGNDSLQGQNGADTFIWTATDGRDTFNGGADSDTLNITASAVNEVANVNWNGSEITGLLNNALISIETVNLDMGLGDDWLVYSTTFDVTVRLDLGGATGFNAITAIENVIGGSGNDFIHGYDGANKINGAAGNDTITGGLGNDNLTGGLGADTFVYSAGDGADTINDFDAWAVGGQDFLDISAFGITAGDFASRVTIIDTGADTVVRIDNDVFITLKNVSGDGDNVITDADFIFGP